MATPHNYITSTAAVWEKHSGRGGVAFGEMSTLINLRTNKRQKQGKPVEPIINSVSTL